MQMETVNILGIISVFLLGYAGSAYMGYVWGYTKCRHHVIDENNALVRDALTAVHEDTGCSHIFSREVNQVLWNNYMFDVGVEVGYENDTFAIKPYDWSDEDDNDWNFWHKPSGFKLSWYKYPLRSARSNVTIDFERFEEILIDCYNSRHPNTSYSLPFPWWKPLEGEGA